MAPHPAALVLMRGGRAYTALERIENGATVSFVEDDEIAKRYPSPGIGLVDVDTGHDDAVVETIRYLARVRRSRDRVSTFDRRILLDDFIEVAPVAVEDIRSRLAPRYRAYFEAGSIPPGTWREARRVLIELRPELAADLERLESARSLPWEIGHEREIAVSEGDAVALALKISGLDVSVHWSPSPEPTPFLEGLRGVRLGEEAVLDRDMHVFGDWQELRPHIIGLAQFEDKGRRLTVVNVNRRPLEETLGVDLIYYTHAYDSYALVQYKMLEGSGEDRYTYRPDRSLADELSRMRAIPQGDWDKLPSSYRLGSGAAFLKFCYREPTELGAGPAPGFYLPLEYWDSLVESGSLDGPRGGVSLKPEKTGRFLNNEQFQALVGSAWVGTRGESSSKLHEIVRSGIEGNRSLVLAAESDSPTG